MDPALLRERDAFKKRAIATPVIETKKKKDESSKGDVPPKKPKWSNNNSSSAPPSNDPNKTMFKGLQGVGLSSSYKFGVLTKIVKHLKQKFQEGDDYPLNLEEILDETNQLDVSGKIKQWLLTEALPNNPKISATYDKYQFNPSLACRDKKSLLRLLKQHDMKGSGGIMRDEVVESVPHAEKILKALDPEIITITRQDKKKVLFFKDRAGHELTVDEEFQKLWRSVAVEGIDDAKIEEYLDKQGIRSMQDEGSRKPVKPPVRRKGQRKKQIKKPKDNEHIADELRHYEDN